MKIRWLAFGSAFVGVQKLHEPTKFMKFAPLTGLDDHAILLRGR
jgi:hypothetical protein